MYARPVALELEFTVEPFEPGAPGPHVEAAEAAARRSAGTVTVGPFGTTLSGPNDAVLQAVGAIVRAAVEAGATRITLQVSADDEAR
jgi:uncharacterized protein YqgV (UPF0045/DUF77 family)